MDDEAGIGTYAFGKRRYDPEIGIWQSVDPVPQYFNMYSYCGGNPIDQYDPDGKATTGGSAITLMTLLGPNMPLVSAAGDESNIIVTNAGPAIKTAADISNAAGMVITAGGCVRGNVAMIEAGSTVSDASTALKTLVDVGTMKTSNKTVFEATSAVIKDGLAALMNKVPGGAWFAAVTGLMSTPVESAISDNIGDKPYKRSGQ